jgi:hypothetical protein
MTTHRIRLLRQSRFIRGTCRASHAAIMSRRRHPPMNKNESFRDYFRRARYDKEARAHLLKTARYTRSSFGWTVAVFSVLAVWQIGYARFHGGALFTRSVVLDVISIVIGLLLYVKMGERIVVLEVMGEPPDPAPAPVPPPAGG